MSTSKYNPLLSCAKNGAMCTGRWHVDILIMLSFHHRSVTSYIIEFDIITLLVFIIDIKWYNEWFLYSWLSGKRVLDYNDTENDFYILDYLCIFVLDLHTWDFFSRVFSSILHRGHGKLMSQYLLIMEELINYFLFITDGIWPDLNWERIFVCTYMNSWKLMNW